ncbi:hypothetical protein E2C01_082393 [Portunus trituberculatus]|uniref:Uncharacterized protein n=1 Tax=Portunus trituberculatus TaxID=210409 RepID=A0A5B7J3Q0_PORTR|nr:hypothetical protein [Portunus trituberculatus]
MSSSDKVYRKKILLFIDFFYFSCSCLWVDSLVTTKLTSCNEHLHVPLYFQFFKNLTGQSL